MCEVHQVYCRLPVREVALGPGESFYFLTDDLRFAWVDLPQELEAILSKLPKTEAEVANLALGFKPQEWFVSYSNGRCQWGPGIVRSLKDRLKHGGAAEVRFAPGGWYSFFAQADEWESLPADVHELLLRRQKEDTNVACIAVGSEMEYFVKFDDGKYYWGGVHHSLDRLLRQGRNIEFIRLGENQQYFALFDNHTAWYGPQDFCETLYEYCLD